MATFQRRQEPIDLVLLVQNNVDIELGKKDGIITITYDGYSSPDALRSSIRSSSHISITNLAGAIHRGHRQDMLGKSWNGSRRLLPKSNSP